MTLNNFCDELNRAVPPVPECFDKAMRATLDSIIAQEAAEIYPARKRAENRPAPALHHVRRGRKRWVAYLLAAVLLLGAVAVAASQLRRNVFEVTLGTNAQNANQLIQYDLAKESFGECDIEIRQAAYDGMTLYLVYSVRERAATELLGELDPDTGERYPTDEITPAMERDNIGWWIDNLWINGQSVNMPGGSAQWVEVGDEPGELLFYQTWCLDQEDVYLSGKHEEISLPIGERQPRDSLVIDREAHTIEKPKAGLVTFYLDCSIRDGVVETHPNEWKDLGDFAVIASDVIYTPIQMYATLQLKINPDSLKRYIEENGEGIYDDKGTLVMPYDGTELVESWIYALQLTDGDGMPVDFGAADNGYFGCQGWGSTEALFTFPYMETYPEIMYLAPLGDDGAPDMTQAVRVK